MYINFFSFNVKAFLGSSQLLLIMDQCYIIKTAFIDMNILLNIITSFRCLKLKLYVEVVIVTR